MFVFVVVFDTNSFNVYSSEKMIYDLHIMALLRGELNEWLYNIILLALPRITRIPNKTAQRVGSVQLWS